jgi:hypothetical protein
VTGSNGRAVLLTSLLLAMGAPSAAAIPAAKDVARRYAEAIVTVERAPNAASQGFFVSSSGMVCTVIPGAVENDVVTVTGDDGIGVAALVVAVDVDGLALVAMQIVPSSPLTALGVSGDGVFSRWLVGLSRGSKGVEAVVGGEEPGGLLLPVPRGAPILNEADDVVAVARKPLGGGRIDAIGVARVRALAQRLRAPPPPPPPTPKKKHHNQHG